MAFSNARFTVDPNGQTLRVSVTVGGSTQLIYTTSALTSSVTQPSTISASTTYYVPSDGYGPYAVSVKRLDGTELYGIGLTKQQLADGLTIAPLPSVVQSARASSSGRALFPANVIAETVPRGLVQTNASVLSTGRMSCVAIGLQAGTVVTSISFLSGTTALSGGTNQFFALYSSALVLLGQSADDTSTAWAANSIKTLSLTTAYTVATSGLYYLGVSVAGTVPTLLSYAGNANVTVLPPIISGTADSSLTATAPNPATALTAVANIPYAYVS